jgi:hypothetical protein
MLSSFIPTDKMKFSYNGVVVSNSRRLDESGDLTGDALNRQRGFAINSNHTRTSTHSIFPEVGKMGIAFVVGKWESPSSSSDSFPNDYC